MDFIAGNQSGPGNTPHPKILVVDDDTLSQRMMQILLARRGYQADVASNGLEAFDAIKLQKYDIVFMDVHMPVMDGIEASRRIREWEDEKRHTYIIALTASYLPNIPEEGQMLFEAGIDNYLAKPFQGEHIEQILKYFLSGIGTSSNHSSGPGQELLSVEILSIEKGIEQVGGDEEIYRELLGDLITELPERLQTIETLFANKDLVGLSRAAHNLSGVAANLGALQLSACARKLDKQSQDGSVETTSPLIRDMQLVAADLRKASNLFLAERVNARSA